MSFQHDALILTRESSAPPSFAMLHYHIFLKAPAHSQPSDGMIGSGQTEMTGSDDSLS